MDVWLNTLFSSRIFPSWRPPAWLRARALWLPNGLLLAALAVTGVLLAQALWLLRGSGEPPQVVSAPSPQGAGATVAPADAVAAAALLGRAPVAAGSAAVRAADLGVSLVGVFAGGQPPLAMIQSGAKVLVLKPGDAVVPGVVIQSIEPDRVLVLRAGVLEALSFPPAPNLDAAPPPSAAALGAPSASSSPAANPPPNATVRAQVQQALKQPQSLLSLVRINPVQQGGALSGYALSPVPGQEAFMRALGLHPGDVITSVDGLPLNNPATLPAILPKLNSGQPMTLLVERGGLPVDVTINLDTLQ